LRADLGVFNKQKERNPLFWIGKGRKGQRLSFRGKSKWSQLTPTRGRQNRGKDGDFSSSRAGRDASQTYSIDEVGKEEVPTTLGKEDRLPECKGGEKRGDCSPK